MFSIEIFIRFIFLSAGGNDGCTMLDGEGSQCVICHPAKCVIFNPVRCVICNLVKCIIRQGRSDGRDEISKTSRCSGYLRVEMHLNVFMTVDKVESIGKPGLDRLSLPGGSQVDGISAQSIAFFHQDSFKSLFCHAEGRFHSGNTSAHHKHRFFNGEFHLVQGLYIGCLGHGHANQILCLFRGLVRIIHVNPGVLIPDIGHFKQILVEARIPDGLLEKSFMGSGGAGGHHHPVDLLFNDDLL